MNMFRALLPLRNAPDSEGGSPAPVTPSPAAADPAPAAATAEPVAGSEPAAAPVAPAGPDFSWVPENYRSGDDVDFQRLSEDFTNRSAELARLQEQRGQVPESPDAYEMAVPEDIDYGEITPPEWFKPTLDPNNPALPEIRKWMHENGVPAESAKGLIGLYARMEAGRAAQFETQRAAQMESLGPQAAERITAIKRSLETRIPDEAQRNALLKTATTADAVRAIENLLSGAPTSTRSSPPPRGANTAGLTGYARLRAATAT